ncbi:MAG: ATP synthase F0 subunit B, partial [Bacteroidales bacterium]|nr:ATP synthase F0 subunit B [Candidatus Equibacterium intestinale]
MSLITPDFGLLFWMVLIFGIVFFLLAKFGFPVITGMVDKRRERIEKSIAAAAEAEEKLASLSQEHARMVEQTRLEQGRILQEAAEARDRIVAQAKQQASDEASKILEKAKLEIAAERESALKDI